jgi:prephenate dehydrogenase
MNNDAVSSCNMYDGIMNEHTSTLFSTASVAIIGLGLMGGSLALALRGYCKKILGVDKDPVVVEKALDRQLVDEANTDLSDILPKADILIIAVPLRSSLELIKKLPLLHPGSPIVIDVGSTKTAVVQAMSALPVRFEAIGGHPMCGKENVTIDNAEASLYQGSIFALVASERTTSHTMEVSNELVKLIGARPLLLGAEQHDQWVAATSHVPHLLATALALSIPREWAAMAGPGFRSTSRLAAGSAEMKTDIFATNRRAILDAVAHYCQILNTLTTLLEADDFVSLNQLFDQGAKCRKVILDGNNGIH